VRLRNGTVDEIPLTTMFSPTYDDGHLLYGTASGDGTSDRPMLASLDPATGEVTPTSHFRLPSGAEFTLDERYNEGRIAYRSAVTSVRLNLVTASGSTVSAGMQFRAGADGSLHLFLLGYGADSPSQQLVGYLKISPSGAVTGPEPLPNPFSKADRHSAAQLVIPPGGTTPMLVYVLEDGVHVYQRAP
jgi:hypothetical protein